MVKNNAEDKPKGLIRYVLLVVSHPVEPTPPQTFAFLNKILPELEAQKDGTEKVGWRWIAGSLSSIDMTALAIETFGNGVMNNSIYIYRTLILGLSGGEAKCLVAYDKEASAQSRKSTAEKKWWQIWK